MSVADPITRDELQKWLEDVFVKTQPKGSVVHRFCNVFGWVKDTQMCADNQCVSCRKLAEAIDVELKKEEQ